MRFRLFGVKISVDFLFFVMLCVSALTDESGMIIWGLLAAAIHECAHITAMKVFRIKISSLRVRCCGMEICADSENAGFAPRFIIAGAGVIVNLMLFPFCLKFEQFAAANLAMGAISALPIMPLDGAAMLKIVAEKLYGTDKAETICTVSSLVFLLPMAVCALLLTMRSKYNCSLLALCICSLASVFETLL